MTHIDERTAAPLAIPPDRRYSPLPDSERKDESGKLVVLTSSQRSVTAGLPRD